MACTPTLCAASVSRFLSRPVIATRAPASANDCAIARPIPRLPPVINATEFFRFINPPSRTVMHAPGLAEKRAFDDIKIVKMSRLQPPCLLLGMFLVSLCQGQTAKVPQASSVEVQGDTFVQTIDAIKRSVIPAVCLVKNPYGS